MVNCSAYVSCNPGGGTNSWIPKVRKMVSLTLLCYCSLVKPVMGVTHSGLGYIVSPVCYLWLWEEEKLLFESFILHYVVWNHTHLFPQIYNVLPCVVTETLQSRVVWNIPFSFCCLHGGDTVLLIKMPCQTCVLGILSSLSRVRKCSGTDCVLSILLLLVDISLFSFVLRYAQCLKRTCPW